MERTLIIFKPDAVQRGLCGEILARFERKGLQIAGAKLMKIPQATAEKHYEPHKGKPFYPGLISFMTSSPVVVLALEGKDAITIENLLLHTSGLIADNPVTDYADGTGKALDRICQLRPQSAPGAKFTYSDVNFIVLGEIVGRISGMPLHDFARQFVFEPIEHKRLRRSLERPSGHLVAVHHEENGRLVEVSVAFQVSLQRANLSDCAGRIGRHAAASPPPSAPPRSRQYTCLAPAFDTGRRDPRNASSLQTSSERPA